MRARVSEETAAHKTTVLFSDTFHDLDLRHENVAELWFAAVPSSCAW